MRCALAIDEAIYRPFANRRGGAEQMMRRAPAIDETSFGSDHPKVANRLNNIAALLQETSRLGDAEPLMRRTVTIFLAFQRDSGYAHPNRDAAIDNYVALLAAGARPGRRSTQRSGAAAGSRLGSRLHPLCALPAKGRTYDLE